MLALIARDAIQADNLTESVLFRLIDDRRPTLLFDEVDAVFGKKNSDATEGIRQVLNSGYRRGKTAWRCRAEARVATVQCLLPKRRRPACTNCRIAQGKQEDAAIRELGEAMREISPTYGRELGAPN